MRLEVNSTSQRHIAKGATNFTLGWPGELSARRPNEGGKFDEEIFS
jgi:hypothetical protein